MFQEFSNCNNQKIQQVQNPAAKILRITIAPLSTKNKTALYTYRDILVKQYFWPGKIFMCRNSRFLIVTKIYIFFFWCFLRKYCMFDKSFDGSQILDCRFSF